MEPDLPDVPGPVVIRFEIEPEARQGCVNTVVQQQRHRSGMAAEDCKVRAVMAVVQPKRQGLAAPNPDLHILGDIQVGA